MVIKTNKLTVMGAAMAAMLFAGQAYAANSVTTSASVEIAAPIAITQTGTLAFGSLVPSASAGTATVAPGGSTVSVSGGVSEIGGSVSSPSYTVTGATGATYSVSVPGPVDLTSGGDTISMALTNDGGGSLTGGTDTFNVGGTLSIDANQPAGSYAGTFSVTVNYQ
jgi:spore coat protein U-like protein